MQLEVVAEVQTLAQQMVRLVALEEVPEVVEEAFFLEERVTKAATLHQKDTLVVKMLMPHHYMVLGEAGVLLL
jgi:hypothetical protein